MSAPTMDQALVAEHVTVGALLETTDGLRSAALDMLHVTDFQDEQCRFAVKVIRQMIAEGVPVDPITLHAYVERNALSDRSPRGSLALWIADRCADVPVPASVCWYALVVREQAARRKIDESAERITASTTGSIAEILTIVAAETVVLAALSERLRGVSVNV